MKKFTSTLLLLLLCIYGWSQAGSLETTTFNASNGFVVNNSISPSAADYGNSVAVQSDGKIVAAVVTNDNIFKIVRYNADGTLDGGFGTGGIKSLYLNGTDECQSHAIAIQSDGKIIVAGYTWTIASRDFALIRLNATDGSLDGTFGNYSAGVSITQIGSITGNAGTDIIKSIAILPDNSIIAAGYSWNGTNNDFVVAKYDANGGLVTGFGASSGYTVTDINGNDIANKVAITSTGQIVVAGASNQGGSSADYALVRYTSGGSLDGTFNPTGTTPGIVTSGLANNDEGYGLAIQSDDYIVITGKITTASFSTTDLFLARYKTDGTLDGGFGTAGITYTNFGSGFANDEGHGVAIQTDGKIVVGGSTDGNSSSYDFMVARYKTDGTIDGTFGTSGNAGLTATTLTANTDIIYDLALSGTHIYTAGMGNGTAAADFALAAYTSSNSPLPVVLTQFYGQKQTGKVLLQWTSTSEENVAQYIVERSNDGKTYTAIGKVAAAGNSNLTQNYSYTDQSPYTSNNNYYRLKVQDLNGSVTYSKILIIKFSGELSTNMQVFPNPAKDMLQVQIPAGFKGITSLQVFDITGHLVKTNRYTLDGNSINTTVDVSTLPTGVYTLKAQAGNNSVVTRFVRK
jgi:uncharacterized delta-60 repeat protein